MTVAHRLVQAHDRGDTLLAEDGHIVHDAEGAISTVFAAAASGAAECEKLPRQDPVEITIEDLLIVLILGQVKLRLRQVPVEDTDVLCSLQALHSRSPMLQTLNSAKDTHLAALQHEVIIWSAGYTRTNSLSTRDDNANQFVG